MSTGVGRPDQMRLALLALAVVAFLAAGGLAFAPLSANDPVGEPIGGRVAVDCGAPVMAYRGTYRSSGEGHIAPVEGPLLPTSPGCGRAVAGRLSGALVTLAVAALAAGIAATLPGKPLADGRVAA